jgi:tight adherence protein B
LFEGVYLIWRSRRGKEAVRVQQRLEGLPRARAAEAQRTVLKERKLSAVSVLERLMRSMAPALRLEQRIIQSGLHWTVARLLLSSAAGGGHIGPASLGLPDARTPQAHEKA